MNQNISARWISVPQSDGSFALTRVWTSTKQNSDVAASPARAISGTSVPAQLQVSDAMDSKVVAAQR